MQLEGRGVLFFADGKPVMSYVVPEKDAASTRETKLAARSSGFRLSARDLKAVSENRDDYTFNDAPVDWYAPQGEWSVISRWPCYADWSFFGGSGLSPVLWSKREYSGDTVVEYYAHNQMDLPKEPGYSAPGNLNVTLFGDGKNPTSGYSFVIAGWDNTSTRLVQRHQNAGRKQQRCRAFHPPDQHQPDVSQSLVLHPRRSAPRHQRRQERRDAARLARRHAAL